MVTEHELQNTTKMGGEGFIGVFLCIKVALIFYRVVFVVVVVCLSISSPSPLE